MAPQPPRIVVADVDQDTIAKVVVRSILQSLVGLGALFLLTGVATAISFSRTQKNWLILLTIPLTYLFVGVLIAISAGPLIGVMLTFLYAYVQIYKDNRITVLVLALWLLFFYGLPFLLTLTKIF